jgi:hypothetical protein
MSKMLKLTAKTFVLAALLTPSIAQAQGRFLTAAEVKPILNATKGTWIAVREYDGQDLLYFTHLLAWRCGLSKLAYGINGAAPVIPWPLTPCDEDSPTPAAIGPDQPIYLNEPLNSIKSVTVQITYDDDTTDDVTYTRKSVLIP